MKNSRMILFWNKFLVSVVIGLSIVIFGLAMECYDLKEKYSNTKIDYELYVADTDKRLENLIDENTQLFVKLSQYENADVLYAIDFILQKNKNIDVKMARRIAEAVIEHSSQFDLDFKLVLAVIWQESRFNHRAKSHQSAQGLMQLIPDTQKSLAKILKIESWDINDIETNVLFGTAYLARLKKLYSGDLKLMLAAYNGGPSCAKKYQRYINGEIPVDSLSSENVGYIRSITNLYGKMNGNN